MSAATRGDSLRLAATTFGILALELAVIRWMSGQIRFTAYFANFVLLSAFLGMGLGLAVGSRRPGLVHVFPPALAGLATVLALAEPFGLMRMGFPDMSISLWGADYRAGIPGFLLATAVTIALFWCVAGVFLLAAIPMGPLFGRLPPLTAYSADLLGSLLGVLAVTAVSAVGAPPGVWVGLGALPLLWATPRLASVLCVLGAIALATGSGLGATFSPYNRIDLVPMGLESTAEHGREWDMSVNRDFHQEILDLSDEAVARTPAGSRRRFKRAVYDLPFRVQGGQGRALIVGAGTGNDVAAALRFGYRQVVAVEIDPTIQVLGARLHAEHPYQSPRAAVVIDDARAYFEQNPDERFDLVCYGLLDSHAMFSALSTLRLDNYVYTVEGIRAAWRHLGDDGLLSVSFSVYAGDWMGVRMYWLIHEATGVEPVAVAHLMNYGVTFLAGRRLDPRSVPTDLGRVIAGLEPTPGIRVPTDDWPFLYLRPRQTPYAYLAVLLAVALTSLLAARRAYGPGLLAAGGFDLPLFLMGAAFMLVETRMVTELGLLFGSTWVVNASVFAGILATVLAVNLAVSGRAPRRPALFFAPLLASLLVIWVLGAGRLNQLPLLARGIVGGLLFALPVAFAGVVFSTLLRRSRNPALSLGSNLLGAVLGGVAEYLSMAFGLRAMTLLAGCLYLLALLVCLRGGRLASDQGLEA